jgi:hypothetical protein
VKRATSLLLPTALVGAIAMALSCSSPNQISLLGGGASGTSAAGANGTGSHGGDSEHTHRAADAGRGCRTDRDCGVSHCDEGSGRCVECLVDSHCETYLCDVNAQTCVGCMRDPDCHAPTQYCDVDDHRCIQCRSASNCSVGEVCVAEAHTCAARCFGPGDCSGSDRQICAAAAGVCVECATDADCHDRVPFCDLGIGSCVPCLVDSDCARGRCTLREHRCVECLTNGDCPDGKTCSSSACAR